MALPIYQIQAKTRGKNIHVIDVVGRGIGSTIPFARPLAIRLEDEIEGAIDVQKDTDFANRLVHHDALQPKGAVRQDDFADEFADAVRHDAAGAGDEAHAGTADVDKEPGEEVERG